MSATPAPPFGLISVQPAYDRALRIARALFVGAEVGVLPDPERTELPLAAALGGQLVWLDSLDGFFAAAPIRGLKGEGTALYVRSAERRAFDAALAEALTDLADSIGWDYERALVAKQQAHSEERLRIIVEEAELHVFEMNFASRTLWKEGASDSFFEAPMTFEALAEDVWCSVHPDDRAGAIAAWEHSKRTGLPFRAEYRIDRSDGREVWVASTAKLINDVEGRPLRLIGALQNITARKVAEAGQAHAEAANFAKSAFLANMSHEIRTPLNGVMGMVQAMAHDPLDSVQRERLDVIRQSGEALLTILNDILDLSKIEAGKLELEALEFDLARLARSVEAAFRPIAEAKGLALTLDLGGASGVYKGDPDRLRQVLNNLVSNAVKFTEAGEVKVAAWGDGDLVRLVVSDTGIGIAPDVVGKLFNSFTQADATTTRRFGGTGLGLSICRQLAELMGGAIEVDSALGQGSVFTVTLPMPKISEAGLSLEPALVATAPRAERSLRVLAAEDNPINQLVLRTLLLQIGVDPVVVEDGAAAIAAWEADEFDVILMDVQMPVVDGPTAARRIRRREASTGRARTPIIAITANVMARQMAEYVAAGMDCCVAKPIAAERLFEALDAVLTDADDDFEPEALRA
ncbi:MAG: ATP-binding protein [Phenylobacterium sp.]|uniref:PAS domain-containing hybrid sensor histidine kinase/response regulator n=1 Tax=Phenylobacterium sp. TaxID=1871053 RepID=UPI0027339D33|nr:PAS domain-containing hybrid sensor histidine kinase/response regulator [Phenylobacterium sp.]MDP3175474.1 ATP-binding protein [Phenylobacterium sp.]